MDKLDAVNDITETVGTLPVSSLTIGHPDVIKAIRKLDRVNKQFQTIGYWFNRVKNVKYIRDASNNIYIPSNVLDVKDDYYVIRGNKLYDAENQTFDFEDDIELTTLYEISFEDLPEMVAEAIKTQAAAEFFSDNDGDELRLAKLERKALRALIRVKQTDLRHRVPSAHTQTAAAKLLRGNPQY